MFLMINFLRIVLHEENNIEIVVDISGYVTGEFMQKTHFCERRSIFLFNISMCNAIEYARHEKFA